MKRTKKSDSKKNRYSLLAGVAILIILAAASVAEAAKLDPESDAFYQKVHFLMTKDEGKIFKSLVTPELRKEFIRYFWEIRDPDPFTEVNEFKEEIERRFEYVSNHLNEGGRPGWKTDRGRIYMLLGPPSRIDLNPYVANPRYRGRLIDWYYDFYDLDSDLVRTGGSGIFLRFVDEDVAGRYVLDPLNISLKALDVMEEMKYNYIAGGEGRRYADYKFNFEVEYRPADKSVAVSVDLKKLEYEEAGEELTARLNVDLIAFENSKRGIKKYSLPRTLKLSKEDVLAATSPFDLEIPVNLRKGKVLLDVVVTDLLAGRKFRKTFKMKIKE